MSDQTYRLEATLQLTADSSEEARERAANALRELRGRVDHVWLDQAPTPLFDDSSFAQIRGQMDLGS